MKQACPLCQQSSQLFYQQNNRIFYKCDSCHGIFLDKNLCLTKIEEQERYKLHNNDVNDIHYQDFVSPITNGILQDFTRLHKGLDFGAGTGPVIAKILRDNNYQIELYDPFFHPFPNLLKQKYDYIAVCEVIEHFHYPAKEFQLLHDLLLPQGKLYCMTDIFDPKLDFHQWYYKNDPTHVFIYQKETFDWIKEEFGFSDVIIEGKLICFF